MTQKMSGHTWTLEEVKLSLEDYTKAELEQHLGKYVKPFLKGEQAWLLKQEADIKDAAEKALVLINNRKRNKVNLVETYAVPFLNSECFKRFLKYLPKDSLKVLEYVVLEASISIKELERRFGIKGLVKSTSKDWRGSYNDLPSPSLDFFIPRDLNPYFYYSYARSDFIFYLPSSLRIVVLALLFPEPLPVNRFIALENPAENKMIQCESVIQEELPGLLIRLQQKPLKLTKKGRPSITSVRSIKKKLNIQEFYPDTEQNECMYIRSKSLIGLLSQSEYLDTQNIPQLIKNLFTHEFVDSFHLPIHLLSYIDGMSRIESYFLQNCGVIYTSLIAELHIEEWLNYEELERSLKMQAFDAFPIVSYALNNLSLKVPDPEFNYSGTKEIQLYPFRAEKLLLWPAFRAAMFLMASWGIVDLIYEEPDISILSETANSPYDGIKAIRLTQLGAFVLGKTDTYESKVKAAFVLKLDQDSLSIILSEGKQERAAMAIASFAKPLGKKRFYTDANMFLGDCKSPADLDHKIRIFKTIFSGELPPNWQKFFDEISQKVNPLEEEKDFSIFRLKPENRNLLQLIARDPELKRLCLKAEGFLILIAKKDVNKFRKRLQFFGYLLE